MSLQSHLCVNTRRVPCAQCSVFTCYNISVLLGHFQPPAQSCSHNPPNTTNTTETNRGYSLLLASKILLHIETLTIAEGNGCAPYLISAAGVSTISATISPPLQCHHRPALHSSAPAPWHCRPLFRCIATSCGRLLFHLLLLAQGIHHHHHPVLLRPSVTLARPWISSHYHLCYVHLKGCLSWFVLVPHSLLTHS